MADEQQALARASEAPPEWWSPLHEFAVHACTGTLVFCIIAIPAIGIGFVVKWLSGLGVPDVILNGIVLGEYALFGVDLALFIYFLFVSAYRAARKL